MGLVMADLVRAADASKEKNSARVPSFPLLLFISNCVATDRQQRKRLSQFRPLAGILLLPIATLLSFYVYQIQHINLHLSLNYYRDTNLFMSLEKRTMFHRFVQMFFSNLVDSLLLQTFLSSHFFHFYRDCEKKHIQCHNITSFKGAAQQKGIKRPQKVTSSCGIF